MSTAGEGIPATQEGTQASRRDPSNPVALALLVLIDNRVVGSTNVYARDREVFGEHAVRLWSAFADPAAVSVYNTQLLVAVEVRAEHLQRALVSRAVVDQAVEAHKPDREHQLAAIAESIVEETVRRARNRRSSSPTGGT
ncbi:MAG TPA: hypothetical protein VN856_23920 [Mycobacterium sp.]|uniref:hypothetical protein n=1 Tax=Mycobacterium sp. TaxID=1785 RepID=UPI002B9FC715|nr:hypothetical protein [Mycobacterium sp.]HXO82924.1 hypothetical protein [Mycobacterium sp.]